MLSLHFLLFHEQTEADQNLLIMNYDPVHYYTIAATVQQDKL